MKNFLLSLLDWIYKKKCYFCGSSKYSVAMCEDCYDTLSHLPLEVNRNIHGVKIYACGLYEKNMQKMIRGLKYHGQRDLAHYQAKFMWEYWKNIKPDEKFQVVPVPIYKTRLKKRKYNHMELVGEEFCKISGYVLNTELIKRVKDTKPQYNLKRFQRMENLSNAFDVDKTKCLDMPILLIDDICTTGSTFESMIEELNKSDIYNITCLATATVDF